MKLETKKREGKVLIIDDDEDYSSLLVSALALHVDYEFCVENDSRLAVATARTFVPDIVLLDVDMPELDGGEIHALFKADSALKDVPVIFLTSMVLQSEVDEHHGLIGGSFYISKSAGTARLISTIAEHLRG